MRVSFLSTLLIIGLLSACKNTPAETTNTVNQTIDSKLNSRNLIPTKQGLDIKVHDENTKVEQNSTIPNTSEAKGENIELIEKEAKKDVPVVSSKKEKVEKKSTQKLSSVTKLEEAIKEVEIKVKEEEKAEEEPPAIVKEAKKVEAFSHEVWDELLEANVSSTGKVNYQGIKKSETKLDAYIKMLSANTPQSGWDREKEMSFWINAYNAGTVKMILNNYPLKSIMDLHGGKPWDVKWLELGEKKYSLNEIEHDILRPKFKDARIHFAVNCAAKSCPALLNKAWTPDNLESNFEKQTKAYINNSAFNTISENSIQISKIFDWYASDFGDIITFFNKYSNVKISPSAKVSYKEYDWRLNN